MIDIRDDTGKLLMRYDPICDMIEVQRRGIKSTINLKQYKESAMSDNVGSMPLGSSHRPERNDIDILSQKSPIINGALMYYRHEQLSYEEVLILMVVTQNRIIETLNKNFMEYKENNPYPDKSATSAAQQEGGAYGRRIDE